MVSFVCDKDLDCWIKPDGRKPQVYSEDNLKRLKANSFSQAGQKELG